MYVLSPHGNQCIFTISKLSPLGKGHSPSIEETGIPPSLKAAFCQIWLKLVHWFRRRRWKCEKFMTMTQTRMTKDKFWSEKLTRAFGSGELKSYLCHLRRCLLGASHMCERPILPNTIFWESDDSSPPNHLGVIGLVSKFLNFCFTMHSHLSLPYL